MATTISESPEKTEAIGHSLGERAEPERPMFLFGTLGTGKTQLVRGIADGVGFRGRVKSPTFSLMQIYQGGRFPIYHFDLYRIENQDDPLSDELENYLEAEGLVVVEWAERWRDRLPRRRKEIHLSWVSETQREIRDEDFGD